MRMKAFPHPDPNSKTLLLVEDDESTNEVLRKLFLSQGFKVISAADGIQATVLLRAARPDIAIIDFEMPGGTGAILYDRIRKLVGSIPVVFISGSATAQNTLKDILARDPATRFLSKPVKISELLPLVGELLYGASPDAPGSQYPHEID